MNRAKDGDTVKIHYNGTLEGGEVFDSSRDRQPLEFLIGNGDVMPGLESSVLGMEAGDTKSIEVPPEEGFGVRRDELIVDIRKSDLPDDVAPSIGQRLRISQEGGEAIIVTITDLSEDTVTLDANHPLAGIPLFFDIELVEIVKVV